MRIMWHKLIKFGYIYNGLLVAVVAISLFCDHSYFFYPPQFATIWNNPIADMIGIISGLGLFLYGVINAKSNFWSGILLGTCAGYLAWLLGIESFHGWGLNYDKYSLAMIMETFTIGFILFIAWIRNPKH